MGRLKRLIFWLVLLLAASGGGFAALYLMPVSLALGPCLKDWTNVNSYQRRESPLAATTLQHPFGQIKVCYGRPSAKGRIVFGSLVPFGEYWRLGANEPTRLFTDRPLEIGDIAVPPGRYSMYVIPERDEWELVVNSSTRHWGKDFSARVLSREIGRDTLSVGRTRSFVETLTIRLLPGETSTEGLMTLEWEHARIEVPLRWAAR